MLDTTIPAALTEMWDIASTAGYDHAIRALHNAADMPGFAPDKAALLLAKKLLVDLKTACARQDLLISNTEARAAYLQVAREMLDATPDA